MAARSAEAGKRRAEAAAVRNGAVRAVLAEASRACARAAATWSARVRAVCLASGEVAQRAHAYLEAATARQMEEWRSRAWSDQWRLGWEANRMLHEWGLGEQYSRVDRPASSVESTLFPVHGKRARP